MASSGNPIDPLTGKPRRGRPPKTPFNQYTGVKARNVDYVRQYLRQFLETVELPVRAEVRAMRRTTVRTTYGGKAITPKVASLLYRSVLNACRLLLACEGIFLFWGNEQAMGRGIHTRDKLNALGKAIEDKTPGKMPDLLRELGILEGGDDAV